MGHHHHVKLTSAELAQLWTAYMNDSASLCKLTYFLANVEDDEVKPVVEQAVALSQSHIQKLTEIFHKENFPVPYGFKLDQDVDLTAPKLFSDTFVLNFVHQMGKIGLHGYSVSLSLVARADVYDYFSECLAESDKLLKTTNELLLSKGIYIRSPYIPIPDRYDFVKRQSLLTGFFGERRPLTAQEIANLYANFQRNALGAASMIGFSQVASSKEVRKFLVRGKEIAQKHCEVFGSILKEDDLPIPMTWDSEVTGSTKENTISDKLMMFFTTALIALSIGYYGASLAVSPRRDLGIQYARLNKEIGLYAEDGANIMIKHGWLEEPPRSLDRDELAQKK